MKKRILFFVFMSASLVCMAQKRTSVRTTAKQPVPVLKTEIDSVYYAYGANLFEKGGLGNHLQQMGILSDTSEVGRSYRDRIEAMVDVKEKAVLKKEMQTKIDSIVKANNMNLTQLINGLREGMSADKARGAYIAGLSIGQQIKNQMLPPFAEQVLAIDKEEINEKLKDNVFIAGLETTAKKGKHLFDDPSSYFDIKITEMQDKAQTREMEKLKEKYKDRIAAEAKFLEENKSRNGVVTLPSGVQYEIIEHGGGQKPTSSDVVKTHYHGTFMDGTVFDSSVERGDPVSFPVNAVIKGWSEVLQLMPVGSKWKVYIPYDMAYGEVERGSIPAFSLLIFDIQLLDIENQDNTDSDNEDLEIDIPDTE